MSAVEELERVIGPVVRDLSESDVRQLLEWIANEHAQSRASNSGVSKEDPEFRRVADDVFASFSPLLRELAK